MKYSIASLILFISLAACQEKKAKYDLIIQNGLIYDGSGKKPFKADIGINADTIAFIGDLCECNAKKTIDAKGMAVSPGFVNMLSWSTESLIHDGRSLGEISQGVTLEVMGEGTSMGPIKKEMIPFMEEAQGDIKYPINWRTLGEYLTFLEKKGISTNIASFVGAATVRANALGFENRSPTSQELEQMKEEVRTAMKEGAVGLGAALIYTPGTYAKTEELIELAKVASQYGGMYVAHLRSEGNKLEEAVNEMIEISQKANIRSEIYHLKAAGKDNWHKMDKIIQKIDSARSLNIPITADMYTYIAGATGLDAAMPTWVQEGGYTAWKTRLQNPVIRQKLAYEMTSPQNTWENLCLAAGPEKTLLIGFKQDSLKKYIGKTLAEVAKISHKTWYEIAMDLVINDGTRVDVVYFLMNEENIKKQIKLPYMSFCSDAASMAPESVFLKSSTHPRAYGNFTRLLGKYVRDEKVISLEEAIRKLTSLPCDNLKIKKRGRIKKGNYADVVIFNPNTIQDKASFEEPHQLSEGIIHVIVNGISVIKEGKHTQAKPGRFIKGPGFGK